MRRFSVWVSAFVALAIVIGVWGLRVRRPLSPPPKPSEAKGSPTSPTAAFTIEGVEGLTLHQDGRKVWELFADTITLDKAQTQATAQGIRKAIYYDAEGRPLFWLSAQTLRYDANAGIVTVEGNLTVHAQLSQQDGGRKAEAKGEWIATAERAIWREREQILEAFAVQGQTQDTRCFVQKVRYAPNQKALEGSGGVVLLRPNLQLTCPSVRANLAQRTYQAQPPVQVVLWVGAQNPLPFSLTAGQPSPPPSTEGKAKPTEKAKPEEKTKPRKIRLKSDKPVNLKDDDLIAQEVVITEEGEDYTVTAQRAIYNRQTEQVQVDGGVRFEDPETIATAPKAQIDARRRIATFFGPVEVTLKPKAERREGQEAKGQAKTSSTPTKEAGSAKTSPEKGSEPSPTNPAEKPAEQATPQKRESFRERVRQRGGKLICERAEYDYRERRVVATGNVQFEQPGRYKGRADKLTYLTRDEVLILEGNIVVDDVRKGHRVQCPRAVINLQTDEAHFDPPVYAELIVTEEEEKPKEEAPKKEAPKEEKPKEEPKPTDGQKSNGSKAGG